MSIAYGRHLLWLSVLTALLTIGSQAYPNTSATSVHSIRIDPKHVHRGRYKPRFPEDHEAFDPRLRIRDTEGRHRREEEIKQFPGTCEKVYTPDGNASQICCQQDESKDEWKCLPSFILVGAQKSGTTALFAYLIDHPEFRAGVLRKWWNETEDTDTKNHANKELHFFDNSIKMRQSLIGYLNHFQPVPRHLRSSYINGDLSPSYMVKYATLQRIRSMLPDAKIIVMVRDPVLRAWSEIQMKIRQDIGRWEWKWMLESHSEAIYGCVESLGLFTSTTDSRVNRHFQSCLPPEIVSDIRWKRFMHSSMRRVLANTDHGRNYSSLFDAKDGLFIRHDNGSIGIRLDGRIGFGVPIRRRGFSGKDLHTKVGNDRSEWDSNIKSIPSDARQMKVEQGEEEKDEKGEKGKKEEKEEDGMGRHEATGNGIRPSRLRKKSSHTNATPELNTTEDADHSPPSDILSPFLSLPFITTLLTEERDNLSNCLSTDRYLRECATSNLRTSSDLSRAHLTRGMYYYQLSNLYSLFPPPQILVLETEELRREPIHVMNRVFRFVGMNVREENKNKNNNQKSSGGGGGSSSSSSTSASKSDDKSELDRGDDGFRVLSNELINEVVQNAMPGFASLSGWGGVKKDHVDKSKGGGEKGKDNANATLKGSVPLGEMQVRCVADVDRLVLPSNLRDILADFFEPHNEKLFRFIGRRFDHW
eukprot:CAMPEP_0184701238 /NCGR_PEP_ID=MMETSP0313-20130426/18801_1 /TAXON_ID=2792 /ORGANISM="Porphyridium aerugineum, Strain SAG 1380-2" /LENGTH=700 /DNA_ID=CAMNT_0027161223 /DNA_START=58 /DNA_END=2157 /DNA_ORIENTATION=-